MVGLAHGAASQWRGPGRGGPALCVEGGRMSVVNLAGTSSLASWLATQDGVRRAQYADYLGFYQGKQWYDRPRLREKRITINYARTFVRKVVSYMFSEPPTWSVPAGEKGGRRGRSGADAEHPAEVALREVAEFNDVYALDFAAAVDAAVLGDGAFKVTWDAGAGLPRYSPVDVAQLYCWWSPDDYRQLMRVVQSYRVRADGGAAAPGTAGASLVVVEDWRPDRLTIERDGVVVRDGANPYPWLPFVVWPNEAVAGEFWGVSDLADIKPLCVELNRRLSTLSRILEYSGAPVAVLENVEGGADSLVMEAGAKWELPENAKAYLLDLLAGGGVELHIKAIEAVYKVVHDVAEVPRTAFGDGEGGLSGVALETLLQPLIQKVRRKRAIWDGVYRRRNAMALDLLAQHGRDVGTRRTVTVWGSITPRDRPQLVADEVALVQADIHSRATAGEVLGDEDPAGELAVIVSEKKALAAAEPKPVMAGAGGSRVRS